MSWWSRSPKPAPVTIIYNVLGQSIDSIQARDFFVQGLDFRNRDWSHAQFKDGHFGQANMQGIILMGANLERAYFRHCDLRGADFSFARLTYAQFLECDLSAATFHRADIHRLSRTRSIVSPETDLPGTYVTEPTVLRW